MTFHTFKLKNPELYRRVDAVLCSVWDQIINNPDHKYGPHHQAQHTKNLLLAALVEIALFDAGEPNNPAIIQRIVNGDCYDVSVDRVLGPLKIENLVLYVGIDNWDDDIKGFGGRNVDDSG